MTGHDGLSFMILKIGWVDERAGRGQERSGEARRKRLRGLMGGRTARVGPMVRLELGMGRGIGMGGREVAIAA